MAHDLDLQGSVGIAITEIDLLDREWLPDRIIVRGYHIGLVNRRERAIVVGALNNKEGRGGRLEQTLLCEIIGSNGETSCKQGGATKKGGQYLWFIASICFLTPSKKHTHP